MALVVENANLTWQRVRIALDRMDSHPVAVEAFKALKMYLATQRGNPELQFVAFDNADIDGASGADLGIDAACKVYGFYAKKTATTEDAYIALFDDATDDAGGDTDQRTTLSLLASSEQAFAIHPAGLDMAAGIVVKSYTDINGTTDTTAGSAADGFVVIGNP